MENKQSLLHTDDDLKSVRTVAEETTDDHQKQEEIDKNMQNNNSTSETEQKNIVNGINNDDALMNTSRPIVTSDKEQQKEATEPTVNNDENETRSKKSWNPKVKYSPMPYHRFPYYTNGHPYGAPAPYYYYSLPSLEKPTPLMFVSTQQPSSSSSSPTSRDTHTNNSVVVSPQNLPPRLRQTSTTETESTSQVSSTTPPNSQPSTTTTPATNGRRHRSILPRGLGSYYSHPPPPLMATPPGVLYPYPPAVHPPGHIAYNIRPPDELEFYAFQQQIMNLPQTSVIWPPTHAGLPPHGHPQFAQYAMNGLPPPYMFNNSVMTQPANSFLNPDAAEWVPSHNDNDIPSSSSSSSDNNILIDDEINFPPLNSTTNNTHIIPTPIKDHIEDNSEHIETSSETISTNDNTTNDNTPILTDNTNISTQSTSKIESSNISSSSQDDNNKSSSSSSSPVKIAPISYSTIISKTSENNKTKKNNTNNQSQVRQQQQPLTNHTHNQLPPRDRIIKQQQQQRIPTTSSSPSNFNSRQRQPLKNNRPMTRNLLPTEAISLSKQQQQQPQTPPSPPIVDDWIEVKSKKTKKFDRSFNDNSTEKFILDEQKHKSVSPPLSLTSTGDNTTATFTSEDDYDDKDNQDLVIIMNNDVSNDYNQIIIDDIHNRLDNNERLLIIMRGCPGSGKSTLAKSLNHGYNGVILSTDDYFIDRNLNRYVFDLNRLDDAHRYNHRRASDAFKRNISPIIIDNTNTQTWEMKPYVSMGKDAGYDILLIEPQTPWRYKARELFKRNCHNLPMKRIRDMLNRFEYNITAQNIIDQLSSTAKSNNNILSSEQENVPEDNEITDPLMTSKKFYDTIDDSLILDDVRLCINDMILFLTSNFYQTTLLSSALTLPTTTTTTTSTSPISTPLSVSFHDLSLISPTSPSLPPTPSTPHSRFHRPLGRFPSTINQDHSFNSEHILRLPSTAFSRYNDTTNLTPPLSTQSSLIAKKRQKKKNKQESNELVLNTNNNNNNNNYIVDEENILLQQQTFNVFLPEDCSDFIVIDEQDNNDWIDNDNRNFNIQMNSLGDHSSTNPYKQNQLVNSKTNELLNIIHKELNKPSRHPSVSTKHIAIQCSSDDFNTDPSDLILIGHHLSSSIETIIIPSIPPLPGYNECGIQVDLNDKNLDLLYEIYSNHLSNEIIDQFYEICHQDIEYTRTQIDEYLQFSNQNKVHIPTLQQLSLHTLNQWNEQIKSINPLFDTKSINDLLQDINDDDERLEDLTINNTSNDTNIEFNDLNHINIPWSILNSLEELYGEIPNRSMILSNNNNSISLPIDNELSISIYQALQKHLIKSNQIIEPVIENKKKIDNTNNQKWKLPSSNKQLNTNIKTNNNNIPSLKQIMKEEQQANKYQKSKQKHQLDYVTEHKLKELQRHFPSFDSDLLHDIFRENEYNYDITLVCISTMLDDNASITTMHQPQSVSSSRPISTIKSIVEPVLESYEILRQDALHHAQQRKELYAKAHQANRYGMCGVASFYIHRASEENQLMKDANRAACERLSQWRLTHFYQTQQLDLHGLHSDEALNLFKQIEQEYNEKNRKTTPKSIHIITGYGKNSIYGGSHGKIRSVILTYLKQRNYKYSEPNKGVILLQLTNAKN
ncbi:unnamed protein product [Adineta steineri]|uniref:Smr domain-containing protein n=1 Tax=Adineta steineri TaxID=433720 RepID=A0A818RQV4_9BILA|nr:unnamed protein product [Adineta steineri]CAF3661110.1 unnamed protein product [Adineta steineri]